jgi:hypothetical protein
MNDKTFDGVGTDTFQRALAEARKLGAERGTLRREGRLCAGGQTFGPIERIPEVEPRKCAVCGEEESSIAGFRGMHKYGPLRHDWRPG